MSPCKLSCFQMNKSSYFNILNSFEIKSDDKQWVCDQCLMWQSTYLWYIIWRAIVDRTTENKIGKVQLKVI